MICTRNGCAFVTAMFNVHTCPSCGAPMEEALTPDEKYIKKLEADLKAERSLRDGFEHGIGTLTNALEHAKKDLEAEREKVAGVLRVLNDCQEEQTQIPPQYNALVCSMLHRIHVEANPSIEPGE